jgi:GAF domain-containing protein
MTGSGAGDVLQSLVEGVVDVLALPGAALIVGESAGAAVLVASEDRARRLGRLEIHRGDGPALECWRTGEPVTVVPGAQAHGRWPWFAREVEAAGLGLVQVLPLRHREQALGALTLCCDARQALGRRDLTVAHALADLAALGMVHQRAAAEARVLSEQLQGALNSRVVIEQAKGLVAGRTGADVGSAFRLLRAYARSHNVGLDHVARRVLDGSLPVDALVARRPAGR